MKPKKTLFPLILRAALLLVALNHAASTVHAQGTAFTYQGQLTASGQPANGTYDLSFSLFNTNTDGSALSGPVAKVATAVSNGLFTVALDFGAAFPGTDRWLEIAVGTNGAALTTLAPRQKLTPAPYAITAANLSGTLPASQLTGTLPAAQLSGTITLAQLPGTLLTNNQSGVSLTGSFAGNGAGVTNVNLVTANSAGAVTWSYAPSFVLASSPVVGSLPESVVAADVNGDGKIDLISADYYGNTLTVLTNNGSGGFTLSSSPAVSLHPNSVAAADVNGDGKIDLISASAPDSFFGGNVSVLTNNGSGGFTLASSLAVYPAYSVVAADVNGDGKMDLIIAQPVPGILSILTNNGSGGFVLSSSPTVGAVAYAVTAADVNSDGKIDLISADKGANTLTILTNNGSGGFTLSSSPGVGSNPSCVVAADVNGDGKIDLISANEGANTLTVLTNNGSGGFALSSSPPIGSGAHCVAAADVNGDGKIDLISANPNADTLTVLTNNGSGGFALSSSPAFGSGVYWVVPADVNGDSKLDLISANLVSDTLTVLLNKDSFTGTFIGNGAGLTALNAANLSGSVPPASLTSVPGASLNGPVPPASLTSVPAASLTGTVADARLSVNVPLLSAGDLLLPRHLSIDNAGVNNGAMVPGLTFGFNSGEGIASRRTSGGNQYGLDFFTSAQSRLSIANSGGVGIGTTTPQALLAVNGAARVDTTAAGYNEGLSLNLPTDMPGGGYGGIHFHNAPRGGGYNNTTIKWGIFYNYSVAGGSGAVSGKGLAFVQNNTETRLYLGTNGNVGVGTINPAYPLQMGSGAYCTPAGVWTSISDRNVKEQFRAIDPAEVLVKLAALPITEWKYKIEPDGVKHLGPTAQDFKGAFGLGESDKAIGAVDESGVALAAIKGLNQKMESENATLRRENAELKARMSSLEKHMNDLSLRATRP